MSVSTASIESRVKINLRRNDVNLTTAISDTVRDISSKAKLNYTLVTEYPDVWLEALVMGTTWRQSRSLNLSAERQKLYKQDYLAEVAAKIIETMSGRVDASIARTDTSLDEQLQTLLTDLSGRIGEIELSQNVTISTSGYGNLPELTQDIEFVRYGDTELQLSTLSNVIDDDSAGEPEYYALWSGNVYVSPRPSESLDITLYYKGYLALANITSLDSKWKAAIKTGLMWKLSELLELEPNRQVYYESLYEKELDKRMAEMPIEPSFIQYSEF